MRQSAAARPDDHAAVERGPGGVPSVLPAAAGTRRSARARSDLDGYVQRPGDSDRGGFHLRARRDGAVRQADQAVTVGFYSPLPPARSGVADYAAALVPELRKLGQVEGDAHRWDAALYHLGNNALHAGIYRLAIDRPGITVLHDAVLQHFFLGQLNESAYIE